MKFRTLLATLAVAGSLASFAHAAVATIVDDTYGDSYDFTYTDPSSGVSTLIGDNTTYNYGSAPTVKAVTNDGSGTTYPGDTSLTHAFVALPNSTFWTVLGTSKVTSATLEYQASNNSIGTRAIELHPLTHAFVAGHGGMPTVKNSGTLNSSLAAGDKGADWATYDGTNAWSTPGGDYDPTAFVTSTVRVSGSLAYFDWDLTALLNNPTTRTEIQQYGLLMRVTDETNYTGNIFASLNSADATTGSKPAITFAAAPEPASIAVAASAGLLVARRRRKMK